MMTDRTFMAAGFVVLLAVIFVRRFRRSFGRQRFRPVRLVFVVGLMSGVASIMLLVSRTPFGFKLVGAAFGVGLAAWALGRTRYGVDDAGRFYVPDGPTGLIVLLLFFGRVLMRLWGLAGPLDRFDALGTLNGAAGDPAGSWAASAPALSSPGTMLALFVLLGYYVTYYTGVLVRGSRLEPPAPS